MNQIYPDVGLTFMLEQIIGRGLTNIGWGLYTNDITPSLADNIATYTMNHVSFPDIVIPWTAFSFQQVFTHIGSIQAPNMVFTNLDVVPCTVYGYVIYERDINVLIAAARFDSAPIVVLPGGTQVVIPILGDLSDLSS